MRFYIGALALTFVFSSVSTAQKVKKGVTQGTKAYRGGGGKFGQQQVGDFWIQHGDELKGAGRVGISVFNVAFPDDDTQTAHMHQNIGGGWSREAKVTMQTVLEGVDPATRQRIADAAYSNFVAELKKSGYEVVEADELARLTPEYTSWTSLPNFSKGRFGTYVAPTGRAVHFLQGDKSRRDTSGLKGQASQTFRGLDRPQAFARSPYLAHDGNVGIIAVTLVIDYGVYSTTGTSISRKGSSVGFEAGVSAQSGTLGDTATILEYWSPRSGGFPAMAALAVPVISQEKFAEVVNGASVVVKADAVRFEKAALEVVEKTTRKLVEAVAAQR